MTQTSLNGRVALVTGASRGIGKGIALALAAAGCDVAVNYASRETEAQGTADAIRALGRRAVVVKGDVSKSADVAALIAASKAVSVRSRYSSTTPVARRLKASSR